MGSMVRRASGVAVTAFILSLLAYRATGNAALLTCAVTFGTIAYHFVMRLIVGLCFQTFLRDRADHTGAWFGAAGVFVVTSVLAAGFDLLFVMVQRYNRPRVRKLLTRSDRGMPGCRRGANPEENTTEKKDL